MISLNELSEIEGGEDRNVGFSKIATLNVIYCRGEEGNGFEEFERLKKEQHDVNEGCDIILSTSWPSLILSNLPFDISNYYQYMMFNNNYQNNHY